MFGVGRYTRYARVDWMTGREEVLPNQRGEPVRSREEERGCCVYSQISKEAPECWAPDGKRKLGREA